MKPNGARKGC
jgi:hypothetical protein